MNVSILPLALMKNLIRLSRPVCSFAALVTAGMLFTTGANALDLVWFGGTGDWNASGNWSINGIPVTQVPGPADNAFITNSGTYTVTLSAASTVGSVTV